MSEPGSAAIPISLRGVTVRYGNVRVLDAISFTVEPGELLALLGPSGCGKTTSLKVISGLQPPLSGDVLFGDRVMNGVAPYRRNVGMVFQNYALFPHMNVLENVMFGLKRQGVPVVQRVERAQQTLDLLRIGNYANAYPDQLSGGQQQRAALARTLVVRPSVLLLDEPLSALDRQLRDSMRVELRSLLKAVGITTIIVTHDQEEALTIADRVAVMRDGRIDQIGSPKEVYRMPRSRFVASFIGQTNYLTGEVVDSDPSEVTVKVDSNSLVKAVPLRRCDIGDRVEIAIRPEVITFGRAGAGPLPNMNAVQARVTREIFAGGTSQYVATLPGGAELILMQTENVRLAGEVPGIGETVTLSWPIERSVVLLDDERHP
ncbi:MAG: ABC transporter ATP-binding protein [Betaproteobacteria bacterium]|nr:ABC transporter ATP-binding protein [Betaproteobacteria bacterium]